MIEKDTFFDVKNEILRNPGKLPIVDMPFAFDPSAEAGPSRQYGTLRKFLESFLLLVSDSDTLVNLEALLHLPDKTVKDSTLIPCKKGRPARR